MSKTRKWLFSIDDMMDSILQIEESAKDHDSAESLYKDWESYRAIERNLQYGIQ